MRPHHQANVKSVKIKFVIEVWLLKVIRYYREKIWRPTKTVPDYYYYYFYYYDNYYYNL